MIEPTELNLRHLDAVRAALVAGSITAAAATVNLSQPSLTQALGKLEKQLDQRLCDRQPGGVRATVAGSLFVERIDRAIHQIAESCRVVRRTARLAPLAFAERRLSMTQLRAFLAVERCGSFALAARALGLSQPSVHRAARGLELVLEVPLLEQVGQVMRPTSSGERIALGVRLALSELRAGLDEVAAVRDQGAGRIAIGTLSLPRANLLPRALALFAAAYPRAEVSIEEASYPDLLSRLRGGELDLLLGALRPHDPSLGIVQRCLFEDDMFVVAGAGHPLAHTDKGVPIGTTDLARYPWIIGLPGAPMRTAWDGMFADERSMQRIECASILVARGLLLDGDWLTLMSPDQFRIEEEAGLLVPILGPLPGSRREIGLTVRADWRATAAQAGMIAMLERVGSLYA